MRKLPSQFNSAGEWWCWGRGSRGIGK